MKEEETTSVKIGLDANKHLNDVWKRTGIGKIELTSRLVDWFCRQDYTLQSIILGQIAPEDETLVFDLIRGKLSRQSSLAASVIERALNDSEKPKQVRRQKSLKLG